MKLKEWKKFLNNVFLNVKTPLYPKRGVNYGVSAKVRQVRRSLSYDK